MNLGCSPESIEKCEAVRRKMVEIVHTKIQGKSDLQSLINRFNFGLMKSDDVLDRKLSLLFGSLLLNLAFNLPFSQSLSLQITGPFIRKGSLIFISFDSKTEKEISTLEKKYSNSIRKGRLSPGSNLFNYLVPSLKGDRSLNFGVSFERVHEVISKPNLFECLPDPLHSEIFINAPLGGKLVSKNIQIEHQDFPTWKRCYYSTHFLEVDSSPFLRGEEAFERILWGKTPEIDWGNIQLNRKVNSITEITKSSNSKEANVKENDRAKVSDSNQQSVRDPIENDADSKSKINFVSSEISAENVKSKKEKSFRIASRENSSEPRREKFVRSRTLINPAIEESKKCLTNFVKKDGEKTKTGFKIISRTCQNLGETPFLGVPSIRDSKTRNREGTSLELRERPADQKKKAKTFHKSATVLITEDERSEDRSVITSILVSDKKSKEARKHEGIVAKSVKWLRQESQIITSTKAPIPSFFLVRPRNKLLPQPNKFLPIENKK